jgi:DNA-binding winged helix-turn-helix (wHTH) protein/tetratricopeptide (TPR) repeat protein
VTTPSSYEFGPFRLDGRRRLLWREGELLAVPPKAVELLLALVERAGEVVTKEELLSRVWPDTFVEEANLSVNVSLARKALGDRHDGQPWIQTVARRGYRFLGPAQTTDGGPRAVAVLPFRPLVEREADEPLGLGLADALITRLASTGRLIVRPTTSIRRYAAPDADPLEAGRRLQVDAVLDGRFRRAGSRLLVSAQLLPVDGSSPLWAERFDEELTQVFAVEEAIAERLAASLVVELSADEKSRLARRHTTSVEAWQAYARGRYFWGRFSRPWIEKAMKSFADAARLDPDYAPPHAGLADAFLVGGVAGAVPAREAWELARQAALAALGRDEQLPEAQLSMGFVDLFERWDWRQAESRFLRAVERAPMSAVPHQWHALLLSLGGRSTEAHRALDRAAEIDPLSLTVSSLRGLVHAFDGDYEAEVEQQRRTLDLDPQHFLGHWGLGSALANAGRHDEAQAELERALLLGEGTAFLEPVLARVLAQAGRAEEARRLLRRVPSTLSYQRATVLALLGERPAALDALRAACEAREAWVVAAGRDPALASLREEPAFAEFLAQVIARR